MLPRSQSIFHLGEEGGVVHCHRGGNHLVAASMGMGGAGGHYGSGTRGGGRRARERERLVVGLQIIVHSQHHHGRHAHAHAASVVLKQMVRPRAAAAAAAGRHGAVSCSFLKACSLCRRELSPTKDVYMYRYQKPNKPQEDIYHAYASMHEHEKNVFILEKISLRFLHVI
jgi:hypothetical protein